MCKTKEEMNRLLRIQGRLFQMAASDFLKLTGKQIKAKTKGTFHKIVPFFQVVIFPV